MKYEIIPHTADVRLKVIGKTQQELFAAALYGMANIIKKNLEKNKAMFSKEINIKASDVTSLLIDFLSEVLTLSHTQKAVFYDIVFLKLNNHEVYAKIMGASVDAFDEDIKAVTYHEAEVCENSSGDLETIIVFDI